MVYPAINAAIQQRCGKCGSPLECQGGESAYTGTFRWYLSCTCKACGSVTEEDGIGFAPEDLRAAIIKQHGLWELSLVQSASKKAIIAKVLKEALGVSTTEAFALASSNPLAFWRGTKAEVDWLVQQLTGAGVEATAIETAAK